jgi:phage terminase small subunit
MHESSELNERQELFCRYYVRRPVGAEAVRAAGYEPVGAAVQACRLLERRDVRARIAALRADVARQHCRDEDAILAKLESIYSQAIEDRQYHAAARALTLQARIAGILPTAGATSSPAPMLRNVNG